MIQDGSFRFLTLVWLSLLTGMLATGGCVHASKPGATISEFLIELSREALSAFLL